MPRTSQLTYAPTHRTLEVAVSAEEMIRRFRDNATVIWNDGREVEKVVAPRVIAHHDGSVTIQYHLSCRLPGAESTVPEILCGRWFPESESVKEYHENFEGRAVLLEDLHLALPIFPADPALPALAELKSVAATKDISPPDFRYSLELTGGASFLVERVAAYRLGRRCVLAGRYRSAEGAEQIAFCKCVRTKKFAHVRKGQSEIGERLESSSAGHLRAPRILFDDPSLGVIISEGVNLPLLYNLLSQPQFPAACRGAGSILRAIHRSPIAGDSEIKVSSEIAEAEKRIQTLQRIAPDFGGKLRESMMDLSARVPEESCDMAISHGDFYDKQVLYGADNIWVIDIDGIVKADPALDYGNFLAHLALRGIQLHGAPGIFQDAEQEFARGYGRINNSFQSRVAWWRCMSLLRLACVYAIRPTWRATAPAIFELAEMYIEQLPITSGRYTNIC